MINLTDSDKGMMYEICLKCDQVLQDCECLGKQEVDTKKLDEVFKETYSISDY